jgi:Lantibiotic dehydratase, N terminus
VTLSILRNAVLRVAAWPVETVDRFEGTSLATKASTVTDQQDAMCEEASELAQAIHAVVPHATDAGSRRWLLGTRRALHGWRGQTSGWELPEELPRRPLDLGVDEVSRWIDRMDEVRHALVAARVAFAAAHDAQMRREVEALREIASDERFRCALTVAEPVVADRWAAVRDQPPSDKARIRRLENTLMRYLLRSCGRPTPGGGWAGVAPVTPSESETADQPSSVEPDRSCIQVVPGPRRASVTIDLDPFAAILNAWRTKWAGRNDVPLRIEPTLFEHNGDYVYEHREKDRCTFFRMPVTHAVAGIVEYWRDHQPTVAEAVSALAHALDEGMTTSQIEEAIDLLRLGGVLREAIDLPVTAPTAWHALDAVSPLLPEPERAEWTTAVDVLKMAARRLALAFQDDDPGGVSLSRTAMARQVGVLWQSAGLPGSPVGRLVRLDLRVPFAAHWVPGGCERISAAIADMLAVQAVDGTAERYRRVQAGAVAQATQNQPHLLAAVASNPTIWTVSGHHASSVPETRSEVCQARGCDPAPAELMWEHLLDAVAGRPSHRFELKDIAGLNVSTAAAGPCGSMILWAVPDGWVKWGRPQPAMFSSRFGVLLDPDNNDPSPPSLESPPAELRNRLAEIGAVQVVGSDPGSHNAAIRARSTELLLEPHDAGPLQGWTVSTEPGSLRPSLHPPMQEASLVPIYDSAANFGGHDSCSRFLRTAAMAQGWELLAWGFPILPAERERWHHLPRLVVSRDSARDSESSETVISSRRWIVDAEVIRRITNLDGSDRYLAWRAEIQGIGASDLVLVRAGLNPDNPELLIRTDSALTVRALFDGLRRDERTTPLVLTELPGDPASWPVQDEAGGHYLSELAVTWFNPPTSAELPPGHLFPGSVLPPFYAALTAVLAARVPRPRLHRTEETPPGNTVLTLLTEINTIYTALVPDRSRRVGVFTEAANWLTRSADLKPVDPDGVERGFGGELPAGSLNELAKLAAEDSHAADPEIAQFHDALEDYVRVTASHGNAPSDLVRAQIVARVVHIHTVRLTGRTLDLVAEAEVLRSLAAAARS